MNASPTLRGLTTSNGFLGSAEPSEADQVQLWLGDRIQGALGYRGYFLLDTEGHRFWTGANDQQLTDEDRTTLFPGDRAFFLLTADEAHTDYRVPAVEIQQER